MSEKKQKREKFSIEELYQNKNFVPPKEKNLETIFEEPRQSKDGAPILTSVRKYRRYLHFDPTEGKIHKRKMKAKKCINKIKMNKLRTRSSTKAIKCEDLSLYILETIGDSSDSDMEVTHHEVKSSPTSVDQNTSECAAEAEESPPAAVEEHITQDNTKESSELSSTNESLESTKVDYTVEANISDDTNNDDQKSDSFYEKLEEPVEKRSSCMIA